MRTLISTSTFPLRSGDGLPRFVYDLAVALAETSQVTALAPGAPGAQAEESLGAVDLIRFSYFIPRSLQRLAYGHGMRDNLRASLLAKTQILPFLLSQTLATRRIVRSRKIQVVNSHWMVPQGLTAAWARGSTPRFAHLLTVHAADVYMLAKLPFGRRLARFIAARSDAILADGSHVRDGLDALLGYESNAVLQPNGVDTSIFRGQQEELPAKTTFPDGYLLFFGRFAEKKGVTYLLRAMPSVLDKYPGIGLVLIGYGTLEKTLREEVAELEIQSAVQFLGRRNHPEIASYLQGCRVAVIPSIIDSHGETEGMPTVVVEAMAAGARVVASAVDGIPDVLKHRENGWLCQQKNPEDLAEKVLEALEDPASSAIVRQAEETSRRYDWKEVAATYLETFERIALRT